MTRNPLVAGIGLIPFSKPGQSAAWDTMGAQAARLALDDAGISYSDVNQAYAGFIYADSTAGQSTLYEVGLSGVPIVNVNNNCATGSTALFLARQAVASGAVDVALALGFEQMQPGALGAVFTDRKAVMAKFGETMLSCQERDNDAPIVAQLFGGAGREHQELYGTAAETFAKISVKARQHAANNPYALFRTPLSLEEVMSSAVVYGPLTRFQCCPPTCGAAAAIIVSPAFARRKGLNGLVEISGQAMTTDGIDTFDPPSMISLVGYRMSRAAARAVYEQAGIGPADIQVAEVHDCFTVNELITYEALGFCANGDAERFICDGENTYGGQIVTNPSGGLLSKGHPLGATGLAQCFELVQQLRGNAGKRQVTGAQNALQHNVGLGGACVVTTYRNLAD